MLKKNGLIVYIILIMIMFFNKTEAKYDKSFFDFIFKSIDGEVINLKKYKKQIILIVNVASKCGFTKQYSSLQSLYDKYRSNGFIVLGIPSNQFGGQEPGTNKEIKEFCETNFNITFPMSDKVDVKGLNAHEIYLWAKKNYGMSAVPKWNFHKILINKKGEIEDTFGSFTEPMSKKITSKIEKLIN